MFKKPVRLDNSAEAGPPEPSRETFSKYLSLIKMEPGRWDPLHRTCGTGIKRSFLGWEKESEAILYDRCGTRIEWVKPKRGNRKLPGQIYRQKSSGFTL